MKKLLKQYNLRSDMQYFEMVAESFLNGQTTQAYLYFDSMPKKERIRFLKASTVGFWKSGVTDQQLMNLFDRL